MVLSVQYIIQMNINGLYCSLNGRMSHIEYWKLVHDSPVHECKGIGGRKWKWKYRGVGVKNMLVFLLMPFVHHN